MEKKFFHLVFQLSKLRVFMVDYYQLKGNSSPYFSTSAAEFTRNKSNYHRCGQAQEYVTTGFGTARKFYRKWDALHLSDLTDEQYAELMADLKPLMEKYNFIETTSFNQIVEMSKLTPKSQFKTLEKWQSYMDKAVSQSSEYSVLREVNKWDKN